MEESDAQNEQYPEEPEPREHSEQPEKIEKTDKYQDLVRNFERADRQLGEDLWLIAEQLLLHRLTRAGEQKRMELASLVQAIHNIISETEGAAAIPREILQLDDSANQGFRGTNEANLAQVFTIAVDTAEKMNSHELYRLIAFLRKANVPKPEPIDLAPLDRTEEILTQSPYDENESEWTL